MHSYSIKKSNLSVDLIHEIVNFLPFDIKWVDSRVSLIFDLFLLKNQYYFIILFNKTVKKVSFPLHILFYPPCPYMAFEGSKIFLKI